MPPVKPPAIAIRAASSHRSLAHLSDQLDRDRDSRAAKRSETARWEMRCWIAVPITTPTTAGIESRSAGADVDVAVDAALGDRAEQADQDDRGEAGAGRQPLAVAEPEDQQGHDDRAAADAEEAAEGPRQGADRGQLEHADGRAAPGPRHRAAILDAVSPESETGDGGAGRSPLDPLRADPARAAILTDVDGTLAPIVERPEQAAVPARASELLAALNERFGLVGCISGRRALEARRLVGVDEIAYAGNHGLELLLPGDDEPRLDPALAGQRARRGRVRRRAGRRRTWRRPGLRLEDKGPIQALHWRGAEDERGAEARAHEIAAEAGRAELEPRWGRKVLELRPVGGGGKDAAVAALLADRRRSPPRSTPATTAPTSTPSAACASCARSGELKTRRLRRRRSPPRRRPSWPKRRTCSSTARPAGWRCSRPWRSRRMPYTDLLRVTVLLTGAEATALAAITAIAANRDSDTTTLVVAAAWWLIALVIGFYLGRPSRAADGLRDTLAAGQDGHLAAAGDPGPDLLRPPLADRRDRDRGRGPRRLLPRRRRDRRRLRPARLARLALPRGGRAGDRAARRGQVLRRPQLRPAPDPAGPHAGPAHRPPRPRLSERRAWRVA